MDTIMALGIAALAGLAISIIGYTILTDSVIRDQEREIARLKAAVRRAETGRRIIP